MDTDVDALIREHAIKNAVLAAERFVKIGVNRGIQSRIGKVSQ